MDPSQVFWDATGGLWTKGALAGKYASVFVSTGTPGGGQEMTVNATLSTLTHHGIIFVPLGYKNVFPLLANLDEVHGGMFQNWSYLHESDCLFSQDPLGVPVPMLVLTALVTRPSWSAISPPLRAANSGISSPRSRSEYNK